jgi:cytochrome b
MDPDEPVKPQARTSRRSVQVWDVPIRLFHWLVVVLVAGAYATARLNWMDWHVRIGETLLALVIFRLLWGCFGSETARFHSFLRSPVKAWGHLRHLFHREPDLQVGHNPAGGWMVVVLLALLLGETLSGIYLNNDIANEGPLTEWVPASIANAITALHEILWDALLAAVVLHVLAIGLYAAAKGHNLLTSMLTGRKHLPARVPAPRRASTMLAFLLLVVGAVATALLSMYL